MALNFARTIKKLRRRAKKFNIKNSTVILSSLVVFTFPTISLSKEVLIDNSFEPTKEIVVANFQSPTIFVEENMVEIKPGDSSFQIAEAERIRLEQEAAKKAKAQELAALQKKRTETVARERRVYSTDVNLIDLYQKAGEAYGVDPKLLQAIHKIETGASLSTSRSSYAGAVGPMQFLPSTWKRYGVDGNGDGLADITNVHDAIYAAAKYLKACGYPNLNKALWGYNPSKSYYNKVIKIMNSL